MSQKQTVYTSGSEVQALSRCKRFPSMHEIYKDFDRELELNYEVVDALQTAYYGQTGALADWGTSLGGKHIDLKMKDGTVISTPMSLAQYLEKKGVLPYKLHSWESALEAMLEGTQVARLDWGFKPSILALTNSVFLIKEANSYQSPRIHHLTLADLQSKLWRIL